jgi:putative Holliday junction resolvase
VRYLAVDLGDKRTGLALGDSVTTVVAPAGLIEVPIADRAGGALLDALVRAIDQQIGAASKADLVVGLPLNMDGTEGPRAKLIRDFAARLAARTGRTIHYQDERLTSSEADWAMARSGLTRGQKKQRRDALAAGVILRDFLARTRAGGPPGNAKPDL